ncbi:MAG TPA: hypothetical protein VN285_06825 [Candidatus Deferrimicrobium sp.]|nr:hypothetical protein [Candidatus Deferrimicrobium sp.]
MALKAKKRGFNLEMRTFFGKEGRQYLVFKTRSGAFNVFAEVEAKQASRECGATVKGTTRQMWNSLWE